MTWNDVVRDAATEWQRPLKKRLIGWGRQVVVPPDDQILVDLRTITNPGRNGGSPAKQLVLRTQLERPWGERIHVSDRHPGRTSIRVGRRDPEVSMGFATASIRVSSANPAAADLLGGEAAQWIDRLWDEKSWIDIAAHRSGTRIIVGEEATTGSRERLHQLIALERLLITRSLAAPR